VTRLRGVVGAPLLVWRGGEYALVWRERAPAPRASVATWLARVARDGVVIGVPRPVATDPADADDALVDAVASGDGLALLWSGRRVAPEPATYVVLSRVDTDRAGHVRHADVLVDHLAPLASPPALAWDERVLGYVGVRSGETDRGSAGSHALLMATEAVPTVADVAVMQGEAAAAPPRVVWTGREFGAAWAGANGAVYFTRAGRDRVAGRVAVVVPSGARAVVGAVWNAGRFAVAWVDARRGVSLAQVTATGERVGADVRLVAGD
jgi:hypothetical protein